MQFDALREGLVAGAELTVPASWGQGRTVYGGISAALACDVLAKGVDPAFPLRYLSINFLKPLAPDAPFRIDVADVSAGRTVITRSASVVQDDVTRVTVKANFVTALDSNIAVTPFAAPTLRHWDADGVIRVPAPPAPICTQNFDFRFATDTLPFMGSDATEIGGWMRFEEPPREFTPAHLVCLTDVWPPVPATAFKTPVPISTINWVIHFAEPLTGIGGDDFLGYLARTNFFSDGYGSSSADVWATDGRLLARSFQTFVIYG